MPRQSQIERRSAFSRPETQKAARPVTGTGGLPKMRKNMELFRRSQTAGGAGTTAFFHRRFQLGHDLGHALLEFLVRRVVEDEQ